MGLLLVEDLLKSLVTQLVAILELSIVLRVLLDSVVRQMDVLVINVLKIDFELLG